MTDRKTVGEATLTTDGIRVIVSEDIPKGTAVLISGDLLHGTVKATIKNIAHPLYEALPRAGVAETRFRMLPPHMADLRFTSLEEFDRWTSNHMGFGRMLTTAERNEIRDAFRRGSKIVVLHS